MISRARLSPTVDRFLAARFLEPFSISLAAFTGTYLLADIFDRFDDLMRYRGFSLLGGEYFLLKVPLIISQLLPIACLAGILLAFSMLSRTGEVLAFQSLGISRVEMAIPLLFIAAVISLLDFGLSETIVPVATRQARYLYTVQLKKRQLKGVFANHGIWVRVRGGFLSADSYDPKRNALTGVTIFNTDSDYSLRNIVKAESALWNGNQWLPKGTIAYRLDRDGRIVATPHRNIRIDISPKDLGLLRQDPEEFSLGELNHYIHRLRRKGLDPGGYVVERDLKYAMPMACLIMVALGVALCLDPRPRSQTLGRSFTLGLAIGFGYWIILGFTSSFGRSGMIPAWLAAWLPNIAFALVATSIFMFGEER